MAHDVSKIAAATSCPLLSVVSPTYNESGNIRRLVEALECALSEVGWELIIVDDDSPDSTWREVLRVGADHPSVHCIRRVGRRGLSSAVVEGAMAARGEFVAVIDADMQHDERQLPRMLSILQTTDVDIVVASRHAEGGSLGEWTSSRKTVSTAATKLSRLLIGATVSDPMSGFFMTRSLVFHAAVHDLSQQGYKILLDLLTASKRPLKVAETPYTFRDRTEGESKLDLMVVAEFIFLLIEKLSHGLIPPRFLLFSIVGGLGLLVHLGTLAVLKDVGIGFLNAQITATLVAMTFNFVINNLTTYRAERLRGADLIVGYLLFVVVCSLGGLANLSVANLAIHQTDSWPLAGAAGALMSAVFNFSVSTKFVWGRHRRRVRERNVAAQAMLDSAAVKGPGA